ncbi:aspartic peptidase domain-containing protein [Podospora appendiculata]|uniref:Aspartic peptidase domain-containing protein n=1 Tax=Podospora appendiculata TaxID=314037 RepID=A0AAE1C9K1_9PEZI|nr:aspartic peptidase domain-containing protein [Podospora appendiculata]
MLGATRRHHSSQLLRRFPLITSVLLPLRSVPPPYLISAISCVWYLLPYEPSAPASTCMLAMTSSSTLILAFSLWANKAFVVTPAPCVTSASPIALPITDVQVDPAVPHSLMKCIPMRLGTPPQDILVLPWPELNNTYIYDQQADCDPSVVWNDEICFVRRGGYFIETNSSTFSKFPDMVSSGSATQEINTDGIELGVRKLLSTSLAGTDHISLSPQTKPSSFISIPIGIPRLRWDNGYTTLHALGLGSNSTALNALVQAGQIPSRVWSIFWGRMWTKDGAMDGSVVLGGYDSDKVIGANLTQPLDYTDTGCWTGMKVTVSNLLVNFRNGTDVNILPRNSAIQCCIVPQRQLLLEAPGSIVDDFEAAVQMKSIGPSFGLHWSAQLFNTSSLFDGDITFVFNTGLQIRVPNNQFLVPFVDIARNGSRIIDWSKRELLMNGLADQPATLGRYFFTAAYLMVDHDAGTFTTWQANPSNSSTLTSVLPRSAENCTAGGAGGDGSTTGKTNGTSSDNGGDSNHSGSGTGSSSNPSPPPSRNIGIIVGAVVGGISFVAFAIVAFLVYRRRKRASFAKMDSSRPTNNRPPRAEGFSYQIDNTQPHEVQGSYELKPIELRADDKPRTLQELVGHSRITPDLAGQRPPNTGRSWMQGSSIYELDGGA